MNNKSWKTTTGGILTAVAAIAAAAQSLLDNDPATNPNWEVLAVALTTAWALINARDKNVTSEQQGLKPAPTVQVVASDKTLTS
jgi:Neuraminidase (sialidase)